MPRKITWFYSIPIQNRTYLISLFENVPPLGMSQDDPSYTKVLEHRRADLARERTLGDIVTILSGDGDGTGESLQAVAEVWVRRSAYDICVKKVQNNKKETLLIMESIN